MINEVVELAKEWIYRSKLDVAYGRVLNVIEHSPIPRLSPFLDLVIFSFLYFVLLDRFIYYVLAPQLVQLMPKEEGKSRGLDELNSTGGSLRLKWAHMIPSFIHALLISVGTIYFVISDPNALSATRHSRISGFSPEIANMVAFSIGYFLWDMFICTFNPGVYGPSFLGHAVMALFGLLASFSTNHCLIFYVNRYLMFEISTIFIDFHWFFAKTGYDKTVIQKIADLLGLLSFLLVRMAFGYYTSYQLMVDFYDWHLSGTGSLFVIVAGTCLQMTSHILNMYWFVKLMRSALKPAPKQKKS